MSQQIIQVPPNFIVNKYKAVKKVTKRVPITVGVSFFKEPGVTYEYPGNVGIWVAESTSVDATTGDAVTEFRATLKGSTLGDLYNSGKPLTINIPNIDFAKGETAQLHNLGAIIPDTNFVGLQQAFEIHDVPAGYLAASWNSYIDVMVRVTVKGSIAYSFNVDKSFYPFPYETKYIGFGNTIPYIAMANPTFVDIDINSLFLNPQSIPAENETDVIYLLHKNV